jgi:tartrate-resistant acid phosphatase type 5
LTRGILVRGIVAALLALAISGAPATQPEITLPVHDGKLRIAIAGDIGDGSGRVAAAMARLGGKLDAIIVPGDIIYPCGARSASDPKWSVVTPLTQLGVPIFAVLGNHDYCGNESAMIGAPIANWNLPDLQYIVRSEIADFAMIDTQPFLMGRDEPASSLIRGAFKTDGKWRIVVGHHTVVSSGYHGYFPRREATRMRVLLKPLRDAKTDFYVCGHDHHLELIDGKPRFIVSGAASEPVPAIVLRNSTIWPQDLSPRQRLGFALIELSSDSMSVSFYDERRRIGGPYDFQHAHSGARP